MAICFVRLRTIWEVNLPTHDFLNDPSQQWKLPPVSNHRQGVTLHGLGVPAHSAPLHEAGAPRLFDDLGNTIIPCGMEKRLRDKRRNTFFCLFALIVGNVLNVGCHGFQFTSPMFSFSANSEEGTKGESNDPATAGP
jgi:hypothetical protein